jgi:acetyl esterase/lipase
MIKSMASPDPVLRPHIAHRLNRVLRTLHVIGVAAGSLLFSSCMAAEPPPVLHANLAMDVRINLPYGPLPAERGDLYLPKGLSSPPPVVVVIHGGGWVTGERNSSAGLAGLLASHGVAAFNIDYRLANADSPDTRWPAQIVDAQLAVRWLRAHAGELGINTTRMGAVGDSAGAQLAVLLGVLPRIQAGDQAGLYPDQSPSVSAVADQFGPTDIPTLPPWVTGCYVPLFGTQTPTADMLASMSPLPNVTPRSAPVLIVQGDTDVVVPPEQSLRLQDILRKQSVPVDYIRFPGGHAYGGLDGKAIWALQGRVAEWLAIRVTR